MNPPNMTDIAIAIVSAMGQGISIILRGSVPSEEYIAKILVSEAKNCKDVYAIEEWLESSNINGWRVFMLVTERGNAEYTAFLRQQQANREKNILVQKDIEFNLNAERLVLTALMQSKLSRMGIDALRVFAKNIVADDSALNRQVIAKMGIAPGNVWKGAV